MTDSSDSNSSLCFRRREFLGFMGRGAVAVGALSSSFLQGCSTLFKSQESGALAPGDFQTGYSSDDALRLGAGLRYHLIVKWGDSLNDQGLKFGNNNDFLAFFPIDGKTSEGLLCVNNESTHSLFVSGFSSDMNREKTKDEVDMEMETVGVSIVHVTEERPGIWKIVPNSKHNRRLTAQTEIPLVSERPIEGSRVALGTLANCAGGSTPWGTYLTCEENYDTFFGEAIFRSESRTVVPKQKHDWRAHYPRPPEHYGWVVEINPWTGEAKKLTALGRFAHECATTRLASDRRCVVYTGDDSESEHLYKFISEKPGSLERGTLYAADIRNGRWIPLDREQHPRLRNAFRDQTDLLIRCREAGKIAAATALDRPEDIEICPRTGAVYVTLTMNLDRQNPYGSILKLEEKNNDPLALEFSSSNFLSGGIETGFACPDNMVFDPKGNLWMTTDVSGSKLNRGDYVHFKNNGLFYIPMAGPYAGRAILVATAPREAEFTGPMFSPDGRTLFLSVQHPGEETQSLNALTSHWPDGGNSIPRSAVVAISGPTLDRLMGF